MASLLFFSDRRATLCPRMRVEFFFFVGIGSLLCPRRLFFASISPKFARSFAVKKATSLRLCSELYSPFPFCRDPFPLPILRHGFFCLKDISPLFPSICASRPRLSVRAAGKSLPHLFFPRPPPPPKQRIKGPFSFFLSDCDFFSPFLLHMPSRRSPSLPPLFLCPRYAMLNPLVRILFFFFFNSPVP